MFEILGYKNEPMPDFEARYPGRLESCLAQPFTSFAGIPMYRGIAKKAAALFYFCIKDHPFENGNKRFAVSVMLLFLIRNDLWLDVHPTKLYDLAKVVAESDGATAKDIKTLADYFKLHLGPFASGNSSDQSR